MCHLVTQIQRAFVIWKIQRQVLRAMSTWNWKMKSVNCVSRCESSEDMAYTDEPLADEEWLKKL